MWDRRTRRRLHSHNPPRESLAESEKFPSRADIPFSNSLAQLLSISPASARTVLPRCRQHRYFGTFVGGSLRCFIARCAFHVVRLVPNFHRTLYCSILTIRFILLCQQVIRLVLPTYVKRTPRPPLYDIQHDCTTIYINSTPRHLSIASSSTADQQLALLKAMRKERELLVAPIEQPFGPFSTNQTNSLIDRT